MNKHTRSYGGRHKRIRRSLLARHIDGSPCDWCGKPMFKDPELNFDGNPLNADHVDPLANNPNGVATRLLHDRCNKQRKDGSRTAPVQVVKDRMSNFSGDSVFEW